jgi:hypothetical protein
MTFYRNPQFLIAVDKDKFKNPEQAKGDFDIQCTFTPSDEESCVKLNLCYAARGVFRVDECSESAVNQSLYKDAYQ